MTLEQPIIRPIKDPRMPPLGPVAVMISSPPDLKAMVTQFGLHQGVCRKLFMSRFYCDTRHGSHTAVAGPIIGAPYAAMVMETLVAWGAQQIIFLGWCGAIDPKVQVGDVIIPESAFIDEGTSAHYAQEGAYASADQQMRKALNALMGHQAVTLHGGRVWSTDAIFRETGEKVRVYQHRRALAVEMETSALFSLGQFYGIPVCSVLVVSDTLADLCWEPGFKEARFKTARQAAAVGIADYVRQNNPFPASASDATATPSDSPASNDT